MNLNGVDCKFIGAVSWNDRVELQFEDLVTGQGIRHTIELTAEECGRVFEILEKTFENWTREQAWKEQIK